MKKYRAREAEKMREHVSFMLFGHVVFLIFEIFVYPFSINLIASELLYIWVLYYGYMTLNACAVYAYIAMMVIAPVNGLLKFGQLAFGMKIFLYILQLAIYGFCGAYLTFKRFSIWTKAKGKADIEREVRNSNR